MSSPSIVFINNEAMKNQKPPVGFLPTFEPIVKSRASRTYGSG